MLHCVSTTKGVATASTISARCRTNLEGQVHLVTGSTDGIGRHTATKLAQNGATVLIHGRSLERVSETVAKIKDVSGNPRIQGYTGDLSSLQQVRQLAEHIKKDHKSIDVLTNNAGVFENYRKESEDGFEMTWAVNVLAPFLLTSLLVDIVKSRIVIVSSLSACGSIDFSNLQQEKGYSERGAYALSKLANQLFSFKLAKLAKDVTVNCLDPGKVNTKMLLSFRGRVGIELNNADNEFFTATHPSLSNTTGKYFVSKAESMGRRVAYDVATQDKLWAIMEEQTGRKF
ncbi:hypothetical protein BSKO_11336 [Bryopsis sp. KO-2023]|nr:hypothetical protein BSKO_11336 [Bryopsis sp. KO-2023]